MPKPNGSRPTKPEVITYGGTSMLPIHYFKLELEHFRDDELWKCPELLVKINQITLPPDAYLSLDSNLLGVDLDTRDTTVFNFQVGSGKTSLFHECMLRYLKQSNKYVIFYVAPFKRLLQQNEAYIRELAKDLHLSIIDCTSEKEAQPEGYFIPNDGLSANIYLMTPEFLLGSGGKPYRPQAKQKADFKADLFSSIDREGKKVILFLDEIHERTGIYGSGRFAHLYQIKPNKVHKIFVASATFTREAVEVTKVVSMLTGRKINIFQADRIKQTIQADLHLHVCTKMYSAANLKSLEDGLLTVLQASIAKGRKIHILTAHKLLAETIHKGKDKLKGVINELTPRLLIGGESETETFDEEQHSIGTTFTTGISINNPNSTMIVILPGTIAMHERKNIDHSNAYGIFTGGSIAIVQALARLRNRGELHIFMPPFLNYIHSPVKESNAVSRKIIDQLKKPYIEVKYEPEQDSFDNFKRVFDIAKDPYGLFMEDIINKKPELFNLHRNYFGAPTQYDFTLSHYADYLINNSYAGGKKLGPFLIWSALNNQLTNCKIKTITIEHHQSEIVTEKQILLSAFIEWAKGEGLTDFPTKPQKLLAILLASTGQLPSMYEPFERLKNAISACRNELITGEVVRKKPLGLYIPEKLKPEYMHNSWQKLIEAIEVVSMHQLIQHGVMTLPGHRAVVNPVTNSPVEKIAEGLILYEFAGKPKIMEGNKLRKLL